MTRSTGGVPALGASGTSTSMSIAANITYPFFSFSFFVPKNPTTGLLDLHIKITQGGAQAVTATPSMASGTPGIPGTVVVMTASHIVSGMNQSMYKVGVNTLVAVPLSAGKAGQVTGTFSVLGAAHTITVDFYAWTPHSFFFGGLTSKGSPLPNVSGAGSFNLNGAGAGSVTLVSPSKVSINGALAGRRTASFTTLKMNFVPEPGTLLLLGAGFAGLALLGSRKR